MNECLILLYLMCGCGTSNGGNCRCEKRACDRREICCGSPQPRECCEAPQPRGCCGGDVREAYGVTSQIFTLAGGLPYCPPSCPPPCPPQKPPCPPQPRRENRRCERNNCENYNPRYRYW
ncbi:MAG: hypothetical protein R3Y32_04125 [Bacillota bacterium]